jgi:hypothetical protein
MAREVVTHIWCDVCNEDDQRTPGEELPPIQFSPQMKPRVLALCEPHKKEWYDSFKELLVNVGQLVEGESLVGSEENKRTVECIVPGCTTKLKNQGSRNAHLRQIHGMTWTEARAKYLEDGQVTLELETTKEKAYTVACDQPGCDQSYSYPEYTRPRQAIGLHKRQAHGIRGATKMKEKASA